jgi:hypothetical protein
MVSLGGERQIERSKLDVALRAMGRVDAIVFVLGYDYKKLSPEQLADYLASFYKNGRMTRSYPFMNELSRKCFFFAKKCLR